MAKKTMYQVFDEINQDDTNNGTQLITLHPDVVSVNQIKKGVHVTMGVPVGVLNTIDVLNGEKILALIIVDRKEYEKKLKS